jgi:heme-degrading monooxygenase HmoA
MPTLPWISVRPADAPAVVMASRFALRRLRDVPRFFLDAMRIHRQVRAADGALGVSLVAHPLQREFFTLSAWRDRAAVDALVRAEPHRSVMGRYRAVMADAAFRFWEVPPDALPPNWDDARRRLTTPPAAEPHP